MGAKDDSAGQLGQRLEEGSLTAPWLRAAAALGHPGAREAHGCFVRVLTQEDLDVLALDREACAHVGLALARRVRRPEPQLKRAIELASSWIQDPGAARKAPRPKGPRDRLAYVLRALPSSLPTEELEDALSEHWPANSSGSARLLREALWPWALSPRRGDSGPPQLLSEAPLPQILVYLLGEDSPTRGLLLRETRTGLVLRVAVGTPLLPRGGNLVLGRALIERTERSHPSNREDD